MEIVWYVKENITYEYAIAFDKVCCEKMGEVVYGVYTEMKYHLNNGHMNFCPFCGTPLKYSGDKPKDVVYKINFKRNQPRKKVIK
jgi:hypothetical protein